MATRENVVRGYRQSMPGAEPYHRHGCNGWRLPSDPEGVGCELRYEGEFPACWNDEDIADHKARLAEVLDYHNPAVTAKVRELADNFGSIRLGGCYPTSEEYDPAKMYMKVQYRKPGCLKLGAACSIDNEDQVMPIAQRLANLLALPLRVQGIGPVTPFGREWIDVKPDGEALWLDYRVTASS